MSEAFQVTTNDEAAQEGMALMRTLSLECDGYRFEIAMSAVLNLLIRMMTIAVADGDDDIFVTIRQAMTIVESDLKDTVGVH